MSRGRGQQTAEQILYGKHSRGERPQAMWGGKMPWQQLGIQVTPTGLGIQEGWFEDYRGWSGTAYFMVRDMMLPEGWIEGQDKYEEEYHELETALEDTVISDAESGLLLKGAEHCRLELEEDDDFWTHVVAGPEANQRFKIATYVIAGIESILGIEGEWALSTGRQELLYITESEVEAVAWLDRW